MKSFGIAFLLGTLCSPHAGASPNDSGIVAPAFPLDYVQSWRTCHTPSHSMIEDIGIPYDVAEPPARPFPNAELQFALIVQRHGTRRSQFEASQTEYYKGMGAGQLLVQGAYELRVSGKEIRRYLQTFSRTATMPKSLPNQNRVDILNETCGFDIRRECASYGLRGDDCTPSSLVNAILTEFPKSTVYARSSALRRTLWSAVFFLEGFYGLPWGCGGTTDELVKTAASHVEGSRCLLREVCDGDPKKVLGLRGHHQEVCTAVALPCIHVPRTEGDGLMAAALHHKVSYAQAEEHFAGREGPRAYVPNKNVQNAIDIAKQIWDMKEFERSGGHWSVGEMWLSEAFAGETTPMKELKTWVENRRKFCAESGECDPEAVPSYESLLEDLKEGFKMGYEAQYGLGGFARFVSSPYLFLFNGISRALVFGRPEDWKELRLLMQVLSGFEELNVDDEDLLKESIKRVKMYLLSFHDFVLVGTMGALQVLPDEVTPFASRFSLELVKAPGGDAREFKRVAEPFDVEKGLNPGGNIKYPKNGYYVRFLLGQPGKTMTPLKMPLCGNRDVCPLNIFLNATYGWLQSYSFMDVTQVFRDRLREFARMMM